MVKLTQNPATSLTFACKSRFLAQAGAYAFFDALHQAGIGRRLDAVGVFQRIDADTFVAGQIEQ